MQTRVGGTRISDVMFGEKLPWVWQLPPIL